MTTMNCLLSDKQSIQISVNLPNISYAMKPVRLF